MPDLGSSYLDNTCGCEGAVAGGQLRPGHDYEVIRACCPCREPGCAGPACCAGCCRGLEAVHKLGGSIQAVLCEMLEHIVAPLELGRPTQSACSERCCCCWRGAGRAVLSVEPLQFACCGAASCCFYVVAHSLMTLMLLSVGHLGALHACTAAAAGGGDAAALGSQFWTLIATWNDTVRPAAPIVTKMRKSTADHQRAVQPKTHQAQGGYNTR